MKWLILILGIASNSAASVLVKVSMTPPRKFPTLSDPWSLFTNVPFLIGLALYGIAFLLYAAALARFPLHIAQPVLTAGAIALVSLSSILLFHEKLNLAGGLGLLFILVGVVLISGQAA